MDKTMGLENDKLNSIIRSNEIGAEKAPVKSQSSLQRALIRAGRYLPNVPVLGGLVAHLAFPGIARGEVQPAIDAPNQETMEVVIDNLPALVGQTPPAEGQPFTGADPVTGETGSYVPVDSSYGVEQVGAVAGVTLEVPAAQEDESNSQPYEREYKSTLLDIKNFKGLDPNTASVLGFVTDEETLKKYNQTLPGKLTELAEKYQEPGFKALVGVKVELTPDETLIPDETNTFNYRETETG